MCLSEFTEDQSFHYSTGFALDVALIQIPGTDSKLISIGLFPYITGAVYRWCSITTFFKIMLFWALADFFDQNYQRKALASIKQKQTAH